jgi:hypothetical protein
MEPSDPLIPPPLSRSVPRLILRLAIIAALVWGGLSLFNWLQAHIAGASAGTGRDHLPTDPL